MRRPLIVGCVLLGVLRVTTCVDPVEAQVNAEDVVRAMRAPTPVRRRPPRMPPAYGRVDKAVAIARLAVTEASLLVKAQEVAAFHAVITNRADRVGAPYQRTAWRYSVGVRNSRYRWVHRLGRAPLSQNWNPRIQEHWPRILDAADRAVAGDLSHGCEVEGRLLHWGGPHVDAGNLRRFVRRGYRRARCAGFANVFLAL